MMPGSPVGERRVSAGAGRPAARTTAVIPAWNEEGTIGSVVARLRAQPCVHEVVVVDSGSSDRTAERANAAGARVLVEPRRGYGRACLTGAQAADGADVILFCDGDGSDVEDQAHRLIDPIAAGRLDLVVGSRMRGRREPRSLAPHQLAGNVFVARVLRMRLGVELSDIGPYRAIRADVLRALGMTEMGYGWPTEMILLAASSGHRVGEVPVDYRARAGGTSKVSGSVRASIAAGLRMTRVACRPRPRRAG
jgi:glycosyltransferase involved in cell wall biosynthesis